MAKALLLFALVAALATVGMAAEYSGRLMDASCHDQQPTAVCDATSTTTAFALNVGGKLMKFDDAGNQKAAAALKNRADRSADPNKAGAATGVIAKVSGTEKDGTIEVTEIQVQ